jgi:hypothetical protein
MVETEENYIQGYKDGQQDLFSKINNLTSDDFNHNVNPSIDEIIEKVKTFM